MERYFGSPDSTTVQLYAEEVRIRGVSVFLLDFADFHSWMNAGHRLKILDLSSPDL
jgi:hypothetical protein